MLDVLTRGFICDPEEENSAHFVISYLEFENTKKTPRVLFFINLVPQARKSVKQCKGELLYSRLTRVFIFRS